MIKLQVRYILTLIKCYTLIKLFFVEFIFWISKDSKDNNEMRFMCFNARILFSQVANSKVRSIILASGTLKPFDVLEEQLQTKFDIKYESMHIIDKSQLIFSVIEQGVDETQLNFTFKNRRNILMMQEWGTTILKIIREAKGGVLIFFPSYDLKNKMIEEWKKTKSYWEDDIGSTSYLSIYQQIDLTK